jgi:hypothetical protein
MPSILLLETLPFCMSSKGLPATRQETCQEVNLYSQAKTVDPMSIMAGRVKNV